MRLPRPRFTIRLIMIVVAIAALLLSGGIGAVNLVRRAKHFRQLASDHTNQEQMWRLMLPNSEQMLELSKKRLETAERTARLAETLRNVDPGFSERLTNSFKRQQKQIEYDIGNRTEWIELCREMIEHYSRLRQEYARAAAHPWESVPNDPPRPHFRPQSPGLQDRPAEPEPIPAKPEHRSQSTPIFTAIPAFSGMRSRTG